MRLGSIPLAVLMAAIVGIGNGCSQSSTAVRALAADSRGAIAQVHWVGVANLNAYTNSEYIRSILELPQAAAVAEQVYTKLSQAPWSTENNRASGLLLPLLRTIADNEGYLEVHPEEWALAIRLPEPKIGLWRSNLPPVLAAWPGIKATTNASQWIITEGGLTRALKFQVQKDWIFLTSGPEKLGLLSKLQQQIASGTSSQSGSSSQWIKAKLDLPRLLPMLGLTWRAPSEAPLVDLAVTGEGQYVRTEGTLSFGKSLKLNLEPWLIPTNLIHDPLIGFAAVRGFAPTLAQASMLQGLGLPKTPNQAFAWAQSTGPMFTFFAVPMPDSVSWIEGAGPRTVAGMNQWLTNNGATIEAEFLKKEKAITWVPVPLLTPTLEAVPGDLPVLLGRMGPPLPARGQPAPPELFSRIVSPKDLVYYSWEITDIRLAHWVFLAQSARVAFNRPQLPSNAPILEFLLAAKSKMGNSVTEVRKSEPDKLSFLRKSHAGFTAAEWHVLSDWIESPAFPRGFHSSLRRGSDILRYEDLLKAPPFRKGQKPSGK